MLTCGEPTPIGGLLHADEAWEGAYQVESLTPVGPWPSGAGGGPVYMRPAPTLRPGAGGTGPVHPRHVGSEGPHAAGGTVKARGEGLEARPPPPVRKLPRKRVSKLVSGGLHPGSEASRRFAPYWGVTHIITPVEDR